MKKLRRECDTCEGYYPLSLFPRIEERIRREKKPVAVIGYYGDTCKVCAEIPTMIVTLIDNHKNHRYVQPK